MDFNFRPIHIKQPTQNRVKRLPNDKTYRQCNIRVTYSLYVKLKQKAATKGVSVNLLINEILEMAVSE